MKYKTITHIGTLPPLKPNSYYSIMLINSLLSKGVAIDFISFKKMYPEFIYKLFFRDTQFHSDKNFVLNNKGNLSVRYVITYINPFTWLKAAFLPKTKIVHLQWWSIPLVFVYFVIHGLLKLRRKKIILTVHNVLPHESSKLSIFFSKIAFLFVDRFIVHSNHNKISFSHVFNVPLHKISVVPMGIHDMYKIGNLTKIKERKKLNIPNDKNVILMFGHIRDYKGIDDGIKAFYEFNKKIKNSVLVIAGELREDWTKYQKLIDELNLSTYVIKQLKYIDMSEVQSYFIASDLVILPYKDFEAQSGIGNIALTFNKPMVVSNVGALPDLVLNKGAVFNVGDYKSLGNKIYNVFSNKKLYKSLCNDTVKLCKIYSWKNVADKTIEVYDLM